MSRGGVTDRRGNRDREEVLKRGCSVRELKKVVARSVQERGNIAWWVAYGIYGVSDI